MKKIISNMFAAFAFALIACTPIKTIISISVNSVDTNRYYLQDFDVSMIEVVVHYSDYSYATIPLKESMMSKEDLDKLSNPGIHTITVIYDGFTTEASIDLYTDETFEVIFKDYDGTVLSRQDIEHGMDAILPLFEPSRQDYIFSGWSESHRNIHSDLEIYAEYEYAYDYLVNGDTVKIIHYKDSKAETIHIPSFIEGKKVTSIASNAFKQAAAAKTIVVPDTVQHIEESAFKEVYYLEKIIVPFVGSTRNSTGKEAMFGYIFGNNDVEIYDLPTRLTEVIITNATSIGDYAFAYAQNLTSITIPEGVTTIGKRAFYQNIRLTSFTIPKSVTSIGEEAFYGASSLTSIIIPEGVTKIAPFTFYQASSLISLTIPEGVTDIGDYAFFRVSKLTSLTIPSTVTNIGRYAFYDFNNITTLTIPDSVTHIGKRAFYGLNTESLTIPKSVVEIGYGAFGGMSRLQRITLPFLGESREAATLPNNSFGYIFGQSMYHESYLADTYYLPNCLTEVVITDITSIGSYAFLNASRITSITIPEGVTEIRERAFSGASSLTSIDLPEGVTRIGNWAFAEMSNLASITLPDSITDIGFMAFYRSGITSLTIPNGVTNIARGALSGTSRLTSITLPFVGINREDDSSPDCRLGYLFGHSEYPDSYQATGYYYPKSLKEVIITDATVIGANAFSQVSSVTSITINDGVTSIGYGAFAGANSLTSISLPNSITHIGSNAFSETDNLSTLTIPNGITVINPYVFSGANGLTSISIPSSVTEIYGYAFTGTSHLLSMTIPESVTYIDPEAFLGTRALMYITVEEDNPNYRDISGVLFNKDQTQLLVYPRGRIGEYRIPDGVTSLADDVFRDFVGLTSVFIPASLTNLGQYGFMGASSLTYIQVDDGNLIYSDIDGVLMNKSQTEILKYPEGRMGEYQIPNGINTISLNAFNDAQYLTKITIANSVTKITSGPFTGARRLTDIIVNGENPNYSDIDGVLMNKDQTVILAYPEGRSGEYHIPNTIIKIDYRSFSNLVNTTSVFIPRSVTIIQSNAFVWSKNLTIYVEVESKPTTWDPSWNAGNLPVVWGYVEA